MARWKSIAIAPKGAVRVLLLLRDSSICVGYFDAYYAEGGRGHDGGLPWCEGVSGERVDPTHWMPLPEAPMGDEE